MGAVDSMATRLGRVEAVVVSLLSRLFRASSLAANETVTIGQVEAEQLRTRAMAAAAQQQPLEHT